MLSLKLVHFSSIIFICIFVSNLGSTYQSSSCSSREEYRCENENCIDRSLYCDGVDNCFDNSDELHCQSQRWNNPSGQCDTGYFRCFDSAKCIPNNWICDGFVDCSDQFDEVECDERIQGFIPALHNAALWIEQVGRKVSALDGGYALPRIVVSLYLANENYFSISNCTGDNISKEMIIHILSKLLSGNIESNELAMFIHGLLAICVNTRNFYGKDLVSMLREKSNNQLNRTNPFVLLALCNAGDEMTEQDVLKLVSFVKKSEAPSWIDIQALTLLALTCITDQPSGPKVYPKYFTTLSTYMKERQKDDGSIESLYTTGLVLQALSGLEQIDHTPFWKDSISYLLKNQHDDGSFHNLVNTYAILPVLNHRSFRNLDFSHCPNLPTTSKSIANESSNRKMGTKKWNGKYAHLQFTLRFNNKTDFELTLKFNVQRNCTLLHAMNVAASLDANYRFEYSEFNGIISVYSLSGLRNDPENEMYWFLYKISSVDDEIKQSEIPLTESLSHIMTRNNEEYIMWYRPDHWGST